MRLLPTLLALPLLLSCSGGSSPAPAPADPRLERGRYLANHVSICFYCHSEIDWKQPGHPPKPERLGAGAAPFSDASLPFLNVPNITPDRDTGIGAWTDAELERALRGGTRRDGRRLFPVMPYHYFQAMSDRDLDDLLAYLKTLPPVKNAVPPSPFPPPVVAMLKLMPEVPARSVPEPEATPVARGRYLATLATCADCHTPMKPDGSRIAGMEFAGGFFMKGSWGEVTSPNLTTAPSGIPHYTEELFLKVMRTGDVGGRKLNAIMPWGYYHGMSDADLKAIFAFLKTLAPVDHRVDNTTPPTPCTKCGVKHGLGDLNR